MAAHQDSTIDRLNREWTEWSVREVPAHWPEAPLTFAQVLAAVPDDPDGRLGSLLARLADDSQAARVVLQAMLPKLIILAARDAQHGIAEYVSQCWLQICAYPLQRRPERIAANLALDTRAALWAATPRTYDLNSDLLERLPQPVRRDPVEIVRAAAGLGLLDRSAAACLAAVYCFGLRSHEAGEQLAIKPDLVRWRNARSLRRLASHAALLVDAA